MPLPSSPSKRHRPWIPYCRRWGPALSTASLPSTMHLSPRECISIAGLQRSRCLPCAALLDTISPQSFINEGAWRRLQTAVAGTISSERISTRRSWGGVGTSAPLRTSKSVRLSVQFLRGNRSTASFVVWAYISRNPQYPTPSYSVVIAGCALTRATILGPRMAADFANLR